MLELSPRERQVMSILYRRGRATVAEVLEEMPDPPSYSAVRATLRVLEEKGQVRHREDGPRYVYRPVVETETARRQALRHLVRTFFGGSAEEAALALLQLPGSGVSKGELKRLSRLIEEAEREGR